MPFDVNRWMTRRLAVLAAAVCAHFGHTWTHSGAASCGCPDLLCDVPVHECARCGVCDHGDNAEAAEQRRRHKWDGL